MARNSPVRRPGPLLLALAAGALAWSAAAPAGAAAQVVASADPLTGARSPLAKNWVGLRALPPQTPILVLAGHADSQGVAGPGTSGAAVGRGGAAPMQPGITDELHWNLAVAREVVARGQQRGLAIAAYEPPLRSIANANDPRTNWSVGQRHVAAGGYALEIHFDAYGPDGVGSGVIPALRGPLTRLDESLAEAFGAYPLRFRGGLGGPRRGLTLLEIGKLEGALEASLRDPERREQALGAIADRVVLALQRGLEPLPADGLAPAWSRASVVQAGVLDQAGGLQPTAATQPAAAHPTAPWGWQRAASAPSSSQF